jgi:hypothetical protein
MLAMVGGVRVEKEQGCWLVNCNTKEMHGQKILSVVMCSDRH